MHRCLDKTVKEEKVKLVVRLKDEQGLKFWQIALQVRMRMSWCQQNYRKAKKAI